MMDGAVMPTTVPTKTYALYIWPYPISDEDRAIIRVAKAQLTDDFQVILTPAFKGGTGDEEMYNDLPPGSRVLMLRMDALMFVDHAVVADLGSVTNPSAGLMAAMEWCLTDKFDPRATLATEMWANLGFKEMSIDDIAYKDISQRLRLDDGKRVPTFQ